MINSTFASLFEWLAEELVLVLSIDFMVKRGCAGH
jgi:hypothetical protein